MLESFAASLSSTLGTRLWPALIPRGVLAINHVLRVQPGAADRLVAHAGKQLRIDWRSAHAGALLPPSVGLGVTPAGLFELASTHVDAPDLCLTVDLPAPWIVARSLAAGERPATEIRGDTDFAADLAWLAEHVRWDAEHDLAQLLGDAPARALAKAFEALRVGLGRAVPRPSTAGPRSANVP